MCTSLFLHLQTASEYERLYWEYFYSSELNLTEVVGDENAIFAYSQHCHEATLALALALHRTIQGWQRDKA